MATITKLPVVRHLSAGATSHVHHLSAGQVRHSSPGASFGFRPLTAAISEVPVDDRQQEVLVRVRTADLQEVTAPGTVTFRFARPEQAATRIDFAIDPRPARGSSARWRRPGPRSTARPPQRSPRP